MELIYIKRRTKKEKRYTTEMGMFTARVTYIKKMAFGLSLKTLHKYRETYYGEVKDCSQCSLSA
jgi:negative regulator of genetic competence, sporulation and motility